MGIVAVAAIDERDGGSRWRSQIRVTGVVLPSGVEEQGSDGSLVVVVAGAEDVEDDEGSSESNVQARPQLSSRASIPITGPKLLIRPLTPLRDSSSFRSNPAKPHDHSLSRNLFLRQNSMSSSTYGVPGSVGGSTRRRRHRSASCQVYRTQAVSKRILHLLRRPAPTTAMYT